MLDNVKELSAVAEPIPLYRSLLSQSDWQSTATNLPKKQAEWLLHQGSLTTKLQQVCTDLNVEIIQQGWQAVNFSEKITDCWVREVWLKSADTPWIFAQTLIPQITVENVAKPVLTLGEKPIGLWLFPQQPQRLTLQWRWDRHRHLYARRSQLALKGHLIEIRELFLADFLFDL